MLAPSLHELVDACRVVGSDSHVAPARGVLLGEDTSRNCVFDVAARPVLSRNMAKINGVELFASQADTAGLLLHDADRE
eukprot:810715-Alexandrium_andersonii.AAC.1